MPERNNIEEILAEAAEDSEAGRDLPANYIRAADAAKEAPKVYGPETETEDIAESGVRRLADLLRRLGE